MGPKLRRFYVRCWLLRECRVSRNLRESLPMFLFRLAWGFRYWLNGVRIGTRGMMKQQLGSKVIHNGVPWRIYNWADGPFHLIRTNIETNITKEYVPKSECSFPLSVSELWHRFRVMYDWYMTSWHGIEVNKKLYPDAFTARPKGG